MRLCHIVPSLAVEHGGPSKSVRALCQALANTPHDVELLSTGSQVASQGEPQVEGSLRVRIFQREWPEKICRSAGLKAALCASPADIVHHHALWLRTLHYAKLHAERGDAKLVISPRGMMSTWAWQFRRGRKKLAQCLLHPGALAGAAGWHATSGEEEREIRALGFTQPICVAPNGVDVPTPAKVAADKAYWSQHADAGERRVALFYSRFHRKKRVTELIDLWLAHGPADWLLLLVGIPEDHSPAELAAYAAKKAAGDRVRVFAGTSVPAPYAIASLFLLPSHNENFGLVIAEAMAHGVPVVVTDSTPWHAINSRGLGWCVSWENYATTLSAATRESASQLAQRGAAAREWVSSEYAWSKSAQKLSAFYATLVAHPK